MKVKLPIFFSLLLILGSQYVFGAEMPVAQKGKLDCSHWDFQKSGIVRLTGQWEFYYSKYYEPEDFKKRRGREQQYIDVPGSWREAYDNKEGPQFGTYRLVINVPQGINPYSIKFPELTNPNRVWVNGVLLPGNSESDFLKEQKQRSTYAPYIYKAGNLSDRVEVVIQMVNSNHYHGGIRSVIFFGSSNSIHDFYIWRLTLQLFLAGIQFIIAIYHLSLYYLRRKDQSNIFFALLCLTMFVRTGVTGENFFTILFPGMSWLLQVKLEALSYYISVLFAFLFVLSLYRGKIHKYFVYGISLTVMVFSLVVIIASPFVYPRVLVPFQILSIVIGLLCIFIFIRSYRDNRKEVIVLLTAWIVLLGCAVNDILFVDNISSSLGYLTPFGIGFFIILQSFIISMRYSKAFEDIELLSKELEQNNEMLEERVKERTVALEGKNKELEQSQLKANIDMDMAVRVQKDVLSVDLPSFIQWDIAFSFIPMTGISGDFYDFYIFDEELQGVCLCDVSGHGISSGLVTMLAKGIIFRSFQRYKEDGLPRVFEEANRELCRQIRKSSYFLTCVMLRIYDDRVEYANGGHIDVIMKDKSGVRILLNENNKRVKGTLLGIRKDYSEYESIEFKVEAGNYICLYSDGLTEATNPKGEEFGRNRLMQFFEGDNDTTADEIVLAVVESLYEFIGCNQVEDDMTLIVLKKK